MDNLSISKISNLDISTVRKVLSSTKLTDVEKVNFLRKNSHEIKSELNLEPSGKEYNILMQNRPLIKFRPLKNSFTKRGDKILLSKVLGIPVSEVEDYVESVVESMKKVEDLKFLPPDKFSAIKTYVYRHGSADQVVNFLDCELAKSKDKLKLIYKTLEYHSGGVADYFIRPIHRMSNKTLVSLYNVIDKNIEQSKNIGAVSETEALEVSEWALKRIYLLQNNSKLINAVKTYKILSK